MITYRKINDIKWLIEKVLGMKKASKLAHLKTKIYIFDFFPVFFIGAQGDPKNQLKKDDLQKLYHYDKIKK